MNSKETHIDGRSVEPVSGRRILFLALAMMLSLTAIARGDDTVTLRAAAAASPKDALKLRDVADLEGDAVKLGDTVLDADWSKGSEPGGWVALDIASVRRALESTVGVNWSRLAIRGSSCIVRRTDTPGPAASAPSVQTDKAPDISTPEAGSVRSMVLPRVAQMLGLDAGSVRIGYEDKDSAILGTAIAGRVAEVEPAGSGDRVPINIRVFEGDRIVVSGQIKVSVLVQRECLIVKSALKRADTLALSSVTIEKRWVGPSVDTAAVADVGSVVKASKLEAGKLLLASDLEPAVVVRRGELVQVSCISGTMVVKTTARATQDAHKGDVVKFEGTDNKKRAFLARVDGPGVAVMVVAGADALAGAAEKAR